MLAVEARSWRVNSHDKNSKQKKGLLDGSIFLTFSLTEKNYFSSHELTDINL